MTPNFLAHNLALRQCLLEGSRTFGGDLSVCELQDSEIGQFFQAFQSGIGVIDAAEG